MNPLYKGRQIDRWVDIYIYIDRQIDTYILVDRQIDRSIDRWVDRQNRENNGLTDESSTKVDIFIQIDR